MKLNKDDLAKIKKKYDSVGYRKCGPKKRRISQAINRKMVLFLLISLN